VAIANVNATGSHNSGNYFAPDTPDQPVDGKLICLRFTPLHHVYSCGSSCVHVVVALLLCPCYSSTSSPLLVQD
jgi:hypothetical protein